jgi:hypothetical protein
MTARSWWGYSATGPQLSGQNAGLRRASRRMASAVAVRAVGARRPAPIDRLQQLGRELDVEVPDEEILAPIGPDPLEAARVRETYPCSSLQLRWTVSSS